MTTEILRPNAVGDYENIVGDVGNGVGDHHQLVDEAEPDENTTYVYQSGITQKKDAYNLENTGIGAEAIINSVTVYFRVRSTSLSAAQRCKIQPFLRLGTDETEGTEIFHTGVAYETYSEILSKPGDGDWEVSDLDSLQVCIGLCNENASYSGFCTQVYVEVDYILPVARKYILEIHNSDGDLVSILHNAYGIRLTEAINEPPLLDFSIPADDTKTTDLVRDNEVWLRNYETGVVKSKFRLILRRDTR